MPSHSWRHLVVVAFHSPPIGNESPLESAERLAAYLAGDLDRAEQTALEAELAREPELRARLAAMRRADDALTELRSPQPSAGFEERLRDTLDGVLAEQLDGDRAADEPAGPRAGAQSTSTGGGTFDELASRRAERNRSPRRWVPAVVGVAAAGLAVVVVSNLGTMGGDDDAGTDTMSAEDSDAGGDAMESFDTEDEGDESAQAEMAAPPEGPVVVASDRSFDDAEIDALLSSPELDSVAMQSLDDARGTEVADRWARALGATPGTLADSDGQGDDAVEEDSAADEAGDEEAAAGGDADGDVTRSDDASVPVRETGERQLDDDDRAAVSRCLEEIVATGTAAIPAYVEFGTYQDEDVLVFGLVTEEPGTDAFTRNEIWVMRRADCSPMELRQ